MENHKLLPAEEKSVTQPHPRFRNGDILEKSGVQKVFRSYCPGRDSHMLNFHDGSTEYQGGWKLAKSQPDDELPEEIAPMPVEVATDQWADQSWDASKTIGVLSRQVAFLKADRDGLKAEIAANLELIPESYRVTVCEGGGLEDKRKSLAVSIAKLGMQAQKLRQIHDNMYLSQGGWIYQGNDEDYLESLTCPVVIQPSELQSILKHRDALDQEFNSTIKEQNRLASACSELRKQVSSLTTDNYNLTQNLARVQCIAEGDVAEWSKESTATAAAVRKLRKSYDLIEAENKKLYEVNAGLEHAVECAHKELEGLKAENTRLTKNVEDFWQQRDDLRKEITEMRLSNKPVLRENPGLPTKADLRKTGGNDLWLIAYKRSSWRLLTTQYLLNLDDSVAPTTADDSRPMSHVYLGSIIPHETDEADTEEFPECRYCGGEMEPQSHVCHDNDLEDDRFCMICVDCLSSGPLMPTEQEAIRAAKTSKPLKKE